MPLYTVISDPYSYPSLEKAAAKLMAFTVLIEDCAELLKTLSLPDFYEELLIRTGYVTMLEGKDDVESRGRLENIRELKSSIVSYCENTDMPTLSGFLEEIALYTDIEQYDAEADAVVMMTMHAGEGSGISACFFLWDSRKACFRAAARWETPRRWRKSVDSAMSPSRAPSGRSRSATPGSACSTAGTTTNIASRFVDEIPLECVEKIEQAEAKI